MWIQNLTEGTCEVGAGGCLGLGPAPGSHYSCLGRRGLGGRGAGLQWARGSVRLEGGSTGQERTLLCPAQALALQEHSVPSPAFRTLPVTRAARTIRNTHSAKLGTFLPYNYTSETFSFPKVCPHVYKYDYILKH